MTTIANAKVVSGENLSSNMDFYTLTTLNAVSEEGLSTAAGRNMLRASQMIGMFAQPVVLSISSTSGVVLTDAPTRTAYGIGSDFSTVASATMYTIKFAVEHANAASSTDTTGSVAGSVAKYLVDETAALALETTTVGAASASAFVFSGNSSNSKLTITSAM